MAQEDGPRDRADQERDLQITLGEPDQRELDEERRYRDHWQRPDEEVQA